MKYLLPITAVAALVAFVIYRKCKEKTRWTQIIKNGGVTSNAVNLEMGRHEHIVDLHEFVNDEVGF